MPFWGFFFEGQGGERPPPDFFFVLVIFVSTFAFAFVLFRLMVFLKKGFSENCSFVGLLLRIELVLIHAVAIVKSVSKLL